MKTFDKIKYLNDIKQLDTKTVTKVNNYFTNVAQELAKNQEKQTKSFRITGKIPMNTVYF